MVFRHSKNIPWKVMESNLFKYFLPYRPYLILVLLATYLAHTTEVDYRGPMHVDLSFLFKLVKDILHKLGKCRNGLFVLILLKIKKVATSH